MEILCHRGAWISRAEQNTLHALRTAWGSSWGVETDLRDRDGTCVVSHDPATAAAWPLVDLVVAHRPGTTLALNVKADGLAPLAAPLLAALDPGDVFAFDMSVPDQLQWLRAGVPVFTRHSDVEPDPVLYDEAAGVWLDAFRSDWWDGAVLERHVAAGKRVAVVSPELHGRDHRAAWDRLAAAGPELLASVALCTDHPAEAAARFVSLATGVVAA
jgi:glycerophosphoryl diester phosphodiesterase